MKKILMFSLLIIIMILCIISGYKIRYNGRLRVMQLSGEGTGYIIETSEKNLVIIDGGTRKDAERIEEIVKEKGNPTIIGWYLTSILPEYSGALCEIIEREKDLKISNIFTSFVIDEEWYKASDVTEEQKKEIDLTINTIVFGKYKEIVTELTRRAEYQMENLFVMPLEVKEEITYQNIKDQNIALKVTNGFENIIFLSSITENRAKNFLTSNMDQFKNVKVVQFSGKDTSEKIKEIIEKIKPEQILISNENKPEFINNEMIFLKDGKEKLIEIW